MHVGCVEPFVSFKFQGKHFKNNAKFIAIKRFVFLAYCSHCKKYMVLQNLAQLVMLMENGLSNNTYTERSNSCNRKTLEQK